MMSKSLEEMTNAELLQYGSVILTKMCNSMCESHLIVSVTPDEAFATTMLRDSLRTCLEGVGDILNGIDLIDDDLAELSDPLFAELQRRFRKGF
jgi:hypothetical protein